MILVFWLGQGWVGAAADLSVLVVSLWVSVSRVSGWLVGWLVVGGAAAMIINRGQPIKRVGGSNEATTTTTTTSVHLARWCAGVLVGA